MGHQLDLKKINGPKISGVAEYLHCLKVSPLNLISQGLKSSFIMKRKEKKGKHCLNQMTKIDIVSNNMYLHHVLPEIVH